MVRRSVSIEVRPTKLGSRMSAPLVKRSRSAPASHKYPASCCLHCSMSVARAGAPPSKAPPPLPPSDYRYSQHMSQTRQNIPVFNSVSGGFLMSLAVDFTHTVRDVERAILYHKQISAKIADPLPVYCTEHILTLCRTRKVAAIRVVVSETNGHYVIWMALDKRCLS